MPQGEGTYGSQQGRPKKVSKAKSKKRKAAGEEEEAQAKHSAEDTYGAAGEGYGHEQVTRITRGDVVARKRKARKKAMKEAYIPLYNALVTPLIEKKDKKWIQKAEKSIEKRGTEGVCTGANFGGSSCRPGTRRYDLAQTFKKMASRRKGN